MVKNYILPFFSKLYAITTNNTNNLFLCDIIQNLYEICFLFSNKSVIYKIFYSIFVLKIPFKPTFLSSVEKNLRDKNASRTHLNSFDPYLKQTKNPQKINPAGYKHVRIKFGRNQLLLKGAFPLFTCPDTNSPIHRSHKNFAVPDFACIC